MNYRQIFARKAECEKRIKEVCPQCPDKPGIYAFYRLDESGIRFAYLGQARSLISRIAQHLQEYDHIALSLKKRGFYNAETNPFGWCVRYWEYPVDELDAMEQDFIKRWADMGYQLFNRTGGGQGDGKKAFDNQRSARGYYDGLEAGKKKAREEIAHLFRLHLDYAPKPRDGKPPTKLQEKAMRRMDEIVGTEAKEDEV